MLKGQFLRTVLFTYVVLFCSSTLHAQSVEEIKEQANELFDQEKYEQVIELLKDKKNLFYKTKADEDKLAYNNFLGTVYFLLADWENAEPLLVEAKNITEKIYGKESPNYESFIGILISLYQNSGKLEKAINCYLQIIGIQEKTKGENSYEYATSLNNLGGLYEALGDYAFAEKYYIEVKDIVGEVLGKEHPDYATSLNNLGYLYDALGNYDLAEKYHIEAKEIRKKVLGKEHPDYAFSLNNLGGLYQVLGNYDLAEKYFLEAKEIREKVLGKEHYSYAVSLNNLGTLYDDLGNYDLAEKYYIEAKEIHEKVLGKEHPSYATSLNNLGYLYNALGNYDLAEKYYVEAKEIDEKVLGKEHPDYAASLNNLGSLYAALGIYDLAEKYYIEAKEIREKVLGKEHPDYAASLNNLGYLYNTLGNYGLAEKYHIEAKEITGKVQGETHLNYATSLNNLGYLYKALGNYDLAEKYYIKAKRIDEKKFGKEHPDYITSLGNLSFLYFDKTDFELSAVYRYEQNDILKKSIYRNFSFLSEKQRESYWSENAFNISWGYNLLFQYPVPKVKMLSFDNILFSKGLLLQTNNAIRDAINASADTTLINQYNELKRIRQQITALQSHSNPGIENALEQLEIKADNLDKIITRSSSVYQEGKDNMAIDWIAVRDNLQPHEVAIEFVDYFHDNKTETDSIMYCALLLRHDSESPEYVPLFESSDLSFISNVQHMPVDRFIQQTYTSGNPRFYNGDKLYELVWQPLEKYLEGAETVYYSPSGVLNKVSFSAIPVDSMVLGDKYDLRLVSSTREVVLRNKKGVDRSKQIADAVIYGGIVYSASDEELLLSAKQFSESPNLYASRFVSSDTLSRSGWGALPGTLFEAKEVERLLNQTNISSVKYVGTNANEESFKQLSGNSPELIHIATHGFFLEDEKDIQQTGFMQMLGHNNNRQVFRNPLLRSGLLMAGANRAWMNEDIIEGIEDGILTAEEIANMNLINTKLIVLSACETGLGEVKNSEGVFGLQRAFKLAGVETLVMSLWKVDDQATFQFMTSFYQHLMLGKNKFDSFRSAQKAIRDEYESPYYWAGFVMMD